MNNRSKEIIYKTIMDTINNKGPQCKQNDIMYISQLAHSQVISYTNDLISLGLIKKTIIIPQNRVKTQKRIVYSLTDKGKHIHSMFTELFDMLPCLKHDV